MSDRIVRAGILKSEKVNSLSWEAEVFYRRLFSVVDDFGRYDANPSILRADLYPLKLETVRESNIERLLADVEEASLVRLYAVSGKRYLEVQNFGQRLRAMRSRYPAPPDNTGGHAPSDDSGCPRQTANDNTGGHVPPETETKRSESEIESKGSFPKRAEAPEGSFRPKTEDEAVKYIRGNLIPVPDDFVRRCFNQLDAVGWIDASEAKREVTKFGAYVKKSYAAHKDNPRNGGRNNSTAGGRAPNSTTSDHEKGF